MSLNTFWKGRLPLNHDKMSIFDTYHVYITKHDFYPDENRDEVYEVQTNYGELKLCLNINVRRAPIPTHHVGQVEYREPYAHCEKCMADVDYLKRMVRSANVVVHR